MNNLKSDENLLAIETSVEGGSLAVFSDKGFINAWKGTREISKAEDLLEQIEKLLKEVEIDKKKIAALVVSKGEGSLTGSKIGLAIAKGLAKSIECKLIVVSIFDALMASLNNYEDGFYITAIPIGNFRIGWRRYHKKGTDFYSLNTETEISTQIEFKQYLLTNIKFQNVIFPTSDENENSLLERFENQTILHSQQRLACLLGNYFINASDKIINHS